MAIKACEGLLLCSSIKEDNAATVIVLYTALCERMVITHILLQYIEYSTPVELNCFRFIPFFTLISIGM